MQRRRLFLFFLLGALLTACGPSESPESTAADAAPDSSLHAAVVREIEDLDAMRSGLAQSISQDEDVDQETFARVCKPVGQRAQTIGRERGWVVQQMAEKYRNPANQLDAAGAEAFARFADDPDRMRLWTRVDHEGTAGWRYYRRITVEPTCLACHGAEEARPAFVRENYPEDRAYGFEVGDLRGLYAVFVPDSLRPLRTSGD